MAPNARTRTERKEKLNCLFLHPQTTNQTADFLFRSLRRCHIFFFETNTTVAFRKVKEQIGRKSRINYAESVEMGDTTYVYRALKFNRNRVSRTENDRKLSSTSSEDKEDK